MDLKSEVEKNIESIFSQAESIVKAGTYKELVTTPRNGNYTVEPTYSTTAISCLVVSFKKWELEIWKEKISAEDKKILVPLKGLSITFKVGNKIVIGTDSYVIKDVNLDPTESLATIHGSKE